MFRPGRAMPLSPADSDGPAPLPEGAAWLHLAGERLAALPSGALWWPAQSLLVVGDLHLGRAERTARTGGGLIPPYGDAETLSRLAAALAATAPDRVVCLGDSFDDMAAAAAPWLAEALAPLARGRDWLWIAGNHDPRAPGLPGTWAEEARIGPLALRHMAAGQAEISGHYHPKARLSLRGRRIARPCFACDGARLILPAFGAYTGGLDLTDPVFDRLLGSEAVAALTGRRVTCLPRRALAAA